MTNVNITLEKICDRQLTMLDDLTFTQRLLFQQLLMFVKNGHTCKYTYKLPFKKIKDIQKRLADQDARNYAIRSFVTDLQELAEKRVCFVEEDGKRREYAWVSNLDIDYNVKAIKYNFCKDLSKTCLSYDGKRFILQLLDFVALESKAAKRLYRFLSGCKNRTVTVHRVSALLKYFFAEQDLTSEVFLKTVINPAIEELNEKNLFTFKNIKAKIITKDGEDFVEIVFFAVTDKHLPIGCKVKKYK